MSLQTFHVRTPVQETDANLSSVSRRRKKDPKVRKILFISFSFNVQEFVLVESKETLSLTHPRWELAHLNDRKTLEG